ncbi:MAG TPA: WG repeat-containing protein, partial [Campylobacterales bacterium]|nr:WG repeat-containing protein [Campylobacterales bacterium]
KTFVDHLDFKGQDLKAVRLQGQWYYVRQDGKAMPVMLNEEGNVDAFKEGLARTRLNGKVGFFDQSLEMVLEPLYDYAFPFHNGVAEICLGCHELASDDSSLLDGGTWKRIDRTGLVLEE